MLNKFYKERGFAPSTLKHYQASTNLYLKIVGAASFDELLIEADLEEKERLPWKERKIKEYLVKFRNYLFENKGEGTAITYLSDIKAIYRHFEIELHKLPNFNSKQVNKIYVKRYEDIPKKAELIDAYYECNHEAQDVLLFASSSGISKVDLLNLTVNDFLTACEKYFELVDQEFPKRHSLVEQLYALKNYGNIIPVFEGCRQKTGSRFVTFASPEFVEHKIQHLIGRSAADKLDVEDKLFDISDSHLSYIVRRINDKLNLGKVGSSRKFRCHQLRAYQATTLLNINTENKFTESEIDTLQGRVNDKTHRAYLVESTSKLFKKYSDSVDELMLFKQINTISEAEVESIKSENDFYKKEIVKNEKKLEEQKERINEIISNQRELEALLGL